MCITEKELQKFQLYYTNQQTKINQSIEIIEKQIKYLYINILLLLYTHIYTIQLFSDL